MSRVRELFSVFLLVVLLICLDLYPAGTSKTEVKKAPRNRAAEVTIVKSSFFNQLESHKAPSGKVYLVLNTMWKNIHPKEKVEKSKLEGKKDHTMGVSALSQGGKKKKKEYVMADVAYMVMNFFDHAYILVDGKSHSLDKLTEDVSGGIKFDTEFTIPKQGDKKAATFVFLIPENSENLAFQFFDYNYGHILLPVKGNLKQAFGTGSTSIELLDKIKSSFVEISARKISYKNEYLEENASKGWHYATVQLEGRSLSGVDVKDIVQVEPTEYMWVVSRDGYFYYSCGGTTTDDGFLRFTPEVFQSQEVVFLVPKSVKLFKLGVRLKNQVYELKLCKEKMPGIPRPLASHKDGNTMKISIFKIQKMNGKVIADLGINSMVESGIEIQMNEQFFIVINGEKTYLDEEETAKLFHAPPTPFVVPPGAFVRFKLVYKADKYPESFYYRGYESEKYFNLEKN